MRSVKSSRVVNVSSIANYRVRTIDWENINSESTYKGINSYSLSNLFRIMLTIELEQRLRRNKYETTAVCCHPGVILTDLFRFLPWVTKNPLFPKLINKLFLHEASQGILPIMEAITGSNLLGGKFIGFNSKRQYKGVPKVVDPNPLAYDPLLRNRLWSLCANLSKSDSSKI